MGVRLRGFDYTQPYFYMVTVKRADGFPEFARVVGDAACQACAALLPARERAAGVRVGRLTAPSGNISLNVTGTIGSLSATGNSRHLRVTFARMPNAAGFARAIASIFSV